MGRRLLRGVMIVLHWFGDFNVLFFLISSSFKKWHSYLSSVLEVNSRYPLYFSNCVTQEMKTMTDAEKVYMLEWRVYTWLELSETLIYIEVYRRCMNILWAAI